MLKKIQKWVAASLFLVLVIVFLAMNSEADAQNRGRRTGRPSRREVPQQVAPTPVAVEAPQAEVKEAEEAAEKLEEAVEEKAVEKEVADEEKAEADVVATEAAEVKEMPAVEEEAPEDIEETQPVAFDMPKVKNVTDEELTEALKVPEIKSKADVEKFIADTNQLRPAGLDQMKEDEIEAQVKVFMGKVLEARLAAMEQFLALEGSSSEDVLEVQSMKFSCLLTLANIDEKNKPRLEAFADVLRKGGDKQLAWNVDGAMIQFDLSQLKEMPTAEEYKGHVRKIFDHFQRGVDEKCLDKGFASVAIQMAMISEQLLSVEEAVAIFGEIQELLRKSEEKDLVEAADSLDTFVKRLKMVGQPFDYTFQALDGKEVKLSDFAGKTTVVLFWSVQNQESLQEVPLLMQLYDFYHEKGLEVVAVCMDADTKELRDVMGKVGFKWTTVLNAPAKEKTDEKEEKVEETPASVFAVAALPTKFVVGTDGKVVHANMDLMDLVKKLEEAYGPLPQEAPVEEVPVEEETEDSDADEKAEEETK